MPHPEPHRSNRSGWLRAAVLGANDGIVSTASLLLGIASAGGERWDIMLAGAAAVVAGAFSMAAGEYVSVKSQADIEAADLAVEARALANDSDGELEELAAIYQARGLRPALARKVAAQLTAFDALGAHARDEIGITDTAAPRPLQAAISSGASFTLGALLPLSVVALGASGAGIALCSLTALALLGALAAAVGGAPRWRGALRVLFWGALAMAATALTGKLFGILAP